MSGPNVAPDDLEEAHDVVLLDRLAALNFAEKERTAPSNMEIRTALLCSAQHRLIRPLQIPNVLCPRPKAPTGSHHTALGMAHA